MPAVDIALRIGLSGADRVVLGTIQHLSSYAVGAQASNPCPPVGGRPAYTNGNLPAASERVDERGAPWNVCGRRSPVAVYLGRARHWIQYRRAVRSGTADPIQPQAPCQRIGARLPLLSHDGREILECGNALHRNLHDLPLADLDERCDARARPSEPG